MKYILIILLFIGQTLKAQVIILDENRKLILKESNGNPDQDRIHFKESEIQSVLEQFNSDVYYIIRKDENGIEKECVEVKEVIV